MSIIYKTQCEGIHAWRRAGAQYIYLHSHDYVEVLYARGGGWTVYLNFKEYRLEKGDVIFIFPEQIHSHEATSAENCVLLFPNILPIYDEVFKHYIPENPVLKNGIDEEADALFIKVSEANQTKSPYAQGIVCGYIAQILGKLLPLVNLTTTTTKNEFPKEIKLISYCSEHYKEHITLSSVAKALNYSPSHLSHLFRDKLKINFAKLITLMRINDAKSMLLGDKSITQIAFEAGFNSVRTFNQAFKAEMKITPGEYRTKYQKQQPQQKNHP